MEKHFQLKRKWIKKKSIPEFEDIEGVCVEGGGKGDIGEGKEPMKRFETGTTTSG